MVEKGYTCRELAAMTDGTLSEEYIRAACHRHGERQNPLPHFASGKKRPVIRVRMTDFIDWYDREALQNA